MIKIKFEVNDEEEEKGVTPLPIENENDGLLSLNFVNNNNLTSSLTNLNNVTSINNNLPKKSKQLNNSTTDFDAGGSKSIKTEPAESSLSLTTQLNNSLNIQSLLRQNRIQNGWTTNEQSIPIGTQQQQQQSLLVSKTTNCDLTEVPMLDQGSLNQNSVEITTTTTTNCDTTTTEMFPGLRASLGRRAKLNVCYSVPMELEPVPRRRKKLPKPSSPFPPSADNSELASNDNGGFVQSGVLDRDTPEQREQMRLKQLEYGSRRMENQTEEQRQRRLEQKRHYNQTVGKQKKKQLLASAAPEQRELMRLKQLEAIKRHMEKETEEQRQQRLERQRQYNQTVGKQRKKQMLASATPEQRELMRLKQLEEVRRHMEKETEEQRQRRLERMRQYNRTVGKQKRQTMTPEEREKNRAYYREKYKNRKLIMEKNKKSLEKSQIGQSQSSTSMSLSSINLVDNSESSTWIGGGEESYSQTTNLESPKPGLSKLPQPTRCQRNAKSNIYLEPSTDSDDSDWDS